MEEDDLWPPERYRVDDDDDDDDAMANGRKTVAVAGSAASASAAARPASSIDCASKANSVANVQLRVRCPLSASVSPDREGGKEGKILFLPSVGRSVGRGRSVVG